MSKSSFRANKFLGDVCTLCILPDVLIARFSRGVETPETLHDPPQGLTVMVESVAAVRYSKGYEHNPGAYDIVPVAKEKKVAPFEVGNFRTVMVSRDCS